jgi:hypothetical protein
MVSNRDFLKEHPLEIFALALTRGDLVLAREAAEETVDIDIVKDPGPKHFCKRVLGVDAFLALVSTSSVDTKRSSRMEI